MRTRMTTQVVLTAITILFLLLWVSMRNQEERKRARTGNIALNRGSQFNLETVGKALRLYAEDNDDRLPPMTNALKTRDSLFPYIPAALQPVHAARRPAKRAKEVVYRSYGEAILMFVQPRANVMYQPNAALDLRKLGDVLKPEATVAYSEAEPNDLGDTPSRNVLFLDGSVRACQESELTAHLQPNFRPR